MRLLMSNQVLVRCNIGQQLVLRAYTPWNADVALGDDDGRLGAGADHTTIGRHTLGPVGLRPKQSAVDLGRCEMLARERPDILTDRRLACLRLDPYTAPVERAFVED